VPWSSWVSSPVTNHSPGTTAGWDDRRVLDRDTYLAVLARDAAAFTDLLRHADLDAAVPDCPDWTVADLASHLGGVHRWAREAVIAGAPGDEPVGPRERDALVAWFEEGAGLLVETLTATDTDAPCWTFGPRPRTASFWVRRQPHETAMHLRDLRRALGAPASMDPLFAADGVDELVTVFFPRQVRLGRIAPLAAGVRLTATDVPDAPWVLAGDGTAPSAAYDATMSGTAECLLLWAWGRTGGAEPAIEGDPAAVAAARAAAIAP
jgi:uncharacterized protein (TIGR03083 family)